jgi:predicted MPP superfamily phosphohydrolase
MSASEITILHLSDIHFKKKKEEKKSSFRQDVLNKMIAAIESHIKEHDKPNFVAVTGDIAFFGKESEYKEALTFFDQLKALLPEETVFLPVPGNHDVDRDQVDEFFSLHQNIVNKELTDKFLENKKKIKEIIHVKFKAFKKFSNKLHLELYKSPEDYFWVRNFEEKNVTFLGLNSAWSSEGDYDRFNIALGYPQVMAALEKSKTPNRVILMHHPRVNWLKDMQYGKCPVELFNNCRLLLHGHDHSGHASVFFDPSRACICLGANASYT